MRHHLGCSGEQPKSTAGYVAPPAARSAISGGIEGDLGLM
jgi:hypothetical protein